jgi:gliding motility-associated-like protein
MGLLVADTGYTNYVWHPSNTGASVTGDSIQVPVPNINSYYVTYVSGGCPDTAKIIVPISTHNAFVPNELVNVFSPNGDNTNDVFYPFYQKNISQSEIASQSKVYELKIFDRWGTLMYQTTDYTQPWDGKTKGGHM